MTSMSEAEPATVDARRIDGAFVRGWRVAIQHRSIVVGLAIVLFMLFVAVFAPVLAPYNPIKVAPVDRLQDIGTPHHILGTDQQGRDVLSRLMYGARTSLMIAVVPLTIAGCIGLLLGSIAGYTGRLADTVIMRGMDIVFGLPPILLAIALAATLGAGLANLLISLTIVLLPPMTRVTHQVVAQLKDSAYVEAAKVAGASSRQIIFGQILPNSLAPVLAYGTSLAGAMVVFGAGISFIGLGIQPPEADWGRMINDGREVLDLHPHVSTLPGLAIFVLAAGFNFIGDGMRDLLDPRMRM
jgi:peptide/nickel transport system permease protein